MKRTGENPPIRYPDTPIDSAVNRWWVARVKPRMEKACALDFLEQKIEYFLPLYTKVTRRRDNNKPRKSVLPLFPGYICFAMAVPKDIYKTGRIATIIILPGRRNGLELFRRQL